MLQTLKTAVHRDTLKRVPPIYWIACRRTELQYGLGDWVGRRTGLRVLRSIRPVIQNGHAIEIGGPSQLFSQKGMLPIYDLLSSVDLVDFNASTPWSSSSTHLSILGKTPWKRHIHEASELTDFQNETYDAALASHCVEHAANPIKVLLELNRVVKRGGVLVLILPNPKVTFDRHRPVTPFEHLLNDLKEDVGEDDLTHLPEILTRHDLTMDKDAGSREQFEARSRGNLEHRCLHHHVFNFRVIRKMVIAAKFDVVKQFMLGPLNLVTVATK